MRNFQLIVYLIIIVGCSQKQTDKRIADFEDILGKKETKAVNSLVSDFEKNLDSNYPNLTAQNAYRQYLKDLVSDSTTNWEKFKFQSDQTNMEFHRSGLWNEVYIKDSLYGLQVNRVGKYMQALYEVKESDSLINEYWGKREAVGIMSNKNVVSGILSLDPDFNDYFHKRIVVLEFSF
tara:strand:- start:1292 stop:1825 length:534 start_codon:yes stop_codon:yes gene_type:complete